jgi:hypothetical protein
LRLHTHADWRDCFRVCVLQRGQAMVSLQCPAPVCSLDLGDHAGYVVAGCMGGIVSVHALPPWNVLAATQVRVHHSWLLLDHGVLGALRHRSCFHSLGLCRA